MQTRKLSQTNKLLHPRCEHKYRLGCLEAWWPVRGGDGLCMFTWFVPTSGPDRLLLAMGEPEAAEFSSEIMEVDRAAEAVRMAAPLRLRREMVAGAPVVDPPHLRRPGHAARPRQGPRQAARPAAGPAARPALRRQAPRRRLRRRRRHIPTHKTHRRQDVLLPKYNTIRSKSDANLPSWQRRRSFQNIPASR